MFRVTDFLHNDPLHCDVYVLAPRGSHALCAYIIRATQTKFCWGATEPCSNVYVTIVVAMESPEFRFVFTIICKQAWIPVQMNRWETAKLYGFDSIYDIIYSICNGMQTAMGSSKEQEISTNNCEDKDSKTLTTVKTKDH